MPAYPDHQDIRPAYLSATDPTLDPLNNIVSGIMWIDTSVSPYITYIRNGGAWHQIGGGGQYRSYTLVSDGAGGFDFIDDGLGNPVYTLEDLE